MQGWKLLRELQSVAIHVHSHVLDIPHTNDVFLGLNDGVNNPFPLELRFSHLHHLFEQQCVDHRGTIGIGNRDHDSLFHAHSIRDRDELELSKPH